MVGLAYVTRYAGMDTVLGLSLTGTGVLFPFFGTLLGWLGVALTGTDAGSNALFGNLQKVTAMQLGLSPILMAAANSAGGVMGKMIDAQSIVVASTATHQQGNEAAIFKAVFVHSIVLACLVGLIVLAYAYLFPHLIPSTASTPPCRRAAPGTSRASRTVASRRRQHGDLSHSDPGGRPFRRESAESSSSLDSAPTRAIMPASPAMT